MLSDWEDPNTTLLDEAQGRAESALGTVMTMLKTQPDNPDFIHESALSHQRLGDVFGRRGISAERLDRKDESVEYFKGALREYEAAYEQIATLAKEIPTIDAYARSKTTMERGLAYYRRMNSEHDD